MESIANKQEEQNRTDNRSVEPSASEALTIHPQVFQEQKTDQPYVKVWLSDSEAVDPSKKTTRKTKETPNKMSAKENAKLLADLEENVGDFKEVSKSINELFYRFVMKMECVHELTDDEVFHIKLAQEFFHNLKPVASLSNAKS